MQGIWEITDESQQGGGFTLDIRANGMVYQNGVDVVSPSGVTTQIAGNSVTTYGNSSAASFRQTFTLEGERLRGTQRVTETKQKSSLAELM